MVDVAGVKCLTPNEAYGLINKIKRSANVNVINNKRQNKYVNEAIIPDKQRKIENTKINLHKDSINMLQKIRTVFPKAVKNGLYYPTRLTRVRHHCKHSP